MNRPVHRSASVGHAACRSSILILLGLLAACQRPTQMLPAAPMFDMDSPPPPMAGPVPPVLRPSFRDDAMRADYDRFAQISRIYFDRGSAVITPEAAKLLDAQAEWLRENPAVKATIAGHADALGTREFQMALGERRAAAMKFHLVARGVGPDRLAVTSFGKQRPVAHGLDEASQRSNRRGETVLIGAPGSTGN